MLVNTDKKLLQNKIYMYNMHQSKKNTNRQLYIYIYIYIWYLKRKNIMVLFKFERSYETQFQKKVHMKPPPVEGTAYSWWLGTCLLQNFLQASSQIVISFFLATFMHWFGMQCLKHFSTLVERQFCAENITVHIATIMKIMHAFFKVWVIRMYIIRINMKWVFQFSLILIREKMILW